jgi:putative peptidoglycan lipid II flippase
VHPRHLLDRYVPRGAILLSVLTFGSYLMGLVRDRILTRTFGAGEELDAFNAAFVIPELSLGIVVASGVAAPFVPMFMGLRRENEPAAQTFGQTILTLAVLAMGVVSVLLFIFAPLTVPIVASGFGPAQQQLYIELFRVMTLTPIIFAASLVLGEVLVADRRFLFYGLAPILYNAGLAFGALVLSPEFGIFGAAIGAVIGALLHLAIRVVGIRGTGFRIRARLALQVAGLRDFFRLALPKTVSSPIEPLTFLFFTNVASTLVAGSITSVSLARNFQSVPVSLIGVAFSLAAFPALATAYTAGDKRSFGRLVRMNTLSIGVLTTCSAIGLIVIGERAIDVLLGGGLFDAEDVQRTALVLGVFAISIPFESLGHLYSRAIYATRHTRLQVVASLIGFAVTIGVTLATVDALKIVAIPLGFTAGSAVRFVLLVAVLLPRVRRMPDVPAEASEPDEPAGPALSPSPTLGPSGRR